MEENNNDKRKVTWHGIVKPQKDSDMALFLGMPFLGVVEMEGAVYLGILSPKLESLYDGHIVPKNEWDDFRDTELRSFIEKVHIVDAMQMMYEWVMSQVDEDNNLLVEAAAGDMQFNYTSILKDMEEFIQRFKEIGHGLPGKKGKTFMLTTFETTSVFDADMKKPNIEGFDLDNFLSN